MSEENKHKLLIHLKNNKFMRDIFEKYSKEVDMYPQKIVKIMLDSF